MHSICSLLAYWVGIEGVGIVACVHVCTRRSIKAPYFQHLCDDEASSTRTRPRASAKLGYNRLSMYICVLKKGERDKVGFQNKEAGKRLF